MRATFHVDGFVSLSLLAGWSLVSYLRERFLPSKPLASPTYVRRVPPASVGAPAWRWN
jgi:hypothetical protein